LKIVHEATAVRKGASEHRGGGVHFLSLLQGEENTPNNFHLTLVYANDYVAPRHRHNFDQVRIVLEGAFGFDREMTQEPGMLGYFTEGTYYTQKSVGQSTTLLLQSGGASGTGYMSDTQLRTAVEKLKTKGELNNGIFTWKDSNGKKHNQDGYEAAWELVRTQKIKYPKPLYEQPILWRGDRFDWELTNQTGVEIRRFAEFTNKQLCLAQLRIKAGATCSISSKEKETLLYCIDGKASIGSENLGAISSVHLLRGEDIQIHAKETTQFYVFGLMNFS
jgi:hypothetical protein